MKKKHGFIIGRFQIPYLTKTQQNILETFLKQDFDSYGIILGVAVTKATKNNPLDFDSRRRMIEEAFPGKFEFYYIKDENDDFIWSENLDITINRQSLQDEFIIYGSKHNFIAHYFGKYITKEIDVDQIDSIEFQKELVSKKVKDTAAWRAGACWSAANRYPVAYHTVDCAIFDDMSLNFVWMAKKANEDKLRFVGGFVDPNDDSAEDAALREAFEETKTKCHIIGYISSRKIDDWRYRNEEDKIITSFFALIKQNGNPVANDDIKELFKVNISTLNKKNVMPEHHKLLEDVQNWVRTKQMFKEHENNI